MAYACLVRSVVTFTCPDGPGIVHSVTGAVVALNGNILESQQYSSPDTGRFFMRFEVEHDTDRDSLHAALKDVARRYDGDVTTDEAGRLVRTMILGSKAPHCVSALLSHARVGSLPITVPLVLANHDDLAPLAQFYGVPFESLPIDGDDAKVSFEQRVRDVIAQKNIELVVLARYMRIVSPQLCDELAGRLINIHHSFLPGFKGADPYAQAHARGVKLIGATAHFVTADLDEGPIIAQRVTPVTHARSVQQMREIGRDIEAVTLTSAVKLWAEHRILLDGVRTVIFD